MYIMTSAKTKLPNVINTLSQTLPEAVYKIES